MDDSELVGRLLTRSEGKDLDFKSSPIIISDPKHKAEFIKNLICMANTPRDGSAFIISGVKCKPDGSKEIVSVSDHPNDADLQELVKGKVEPIPQFSYRPVSYGGNSLGILEINPRKDGPFMPRLEYPGVITRGPVYFRRGSSNAIASSAELREIIEWMKTEERSSRQLKLLRAAYVDVGGSLFNYPCFFPSISSLRTQLKPLGYLQILRASTYPWFLISAYDVYNSEEDERRKLGELLKETSSRKKILLDCGYYESSWKNDEEWTEDKFWEIMKSYEFSFAFTFDKKDRVVATSEDNIIKKVVDRWMRDSDATTNGSIIPIVHSETEKFPEILQRIVQTINPVMIAVPERELGEGIVATSKTIIKIREALNQTGAYYPLHLLGTGNPLSILLYTICGADSFDGLEWCQMAVNYDTALTNHLQHYDFFEVQSDWRSVPGYSRDLSALMHNLDFYLAWMKTIREVMAKDEAINLLREYLPIVRDKNGDKKSTFEMLKEKLPELFEGVQS
jgi:queuine/archaeosine tRNA-ribosyltransferase